MPKGKRALLPEFHFRMKIDHIPTLFTRKRHALLVLQTAQGKFLLGSKTIYPEGIYRFAGGGVDEGEDPIEAGVRELQEETGIVRSKKDVKPLALVILDVTDSSGDKKSNYHFETNLMLIDVGDEKGKASDDVQDLVELTREEVEELVERYFHLPDEVADLENGRDSFRWSDYGRFYGWVHRIAMELTK
ncbi:MAG: hypothetical protein UX04_C0007G0029 [Microgenomates group bacterium GW2011_GWF2_45_18]|nr:MAG: hypothetical protein UW18_C0002G0125 [Microgenomates group bacterium GW2011_GWF1_44_10]KKU01440.1 MAG: hypothetical protein UX04_C0007G0029 [Microgenomates group bacterium GW2011_GWF2_45_18]OGJ41516.1 MAG: hypothetical protein A2378_00535 [Candidatus Pacebacteria bacterium RIFOXYB1_FULL_44_10]HAU98844.1 hypothetical protein [Candidatus Paceibacterota bacterium]HAX01198.1 hypothetical protein [Candidatus Paceibacterota bacterium]